MLRYSATAVAYVTDYRTPYGVDMGNVGENGPALRKDGLRVRIHAVTRKLVDPLRKVGGRGRVAACRLGLGPVR